jgi:hypothetical protein
VEALRSTVELANVAGMRQEDTEAEMIVGTSVEVAMLPHVPDKRPLFVLVDEAATDQAGESPKHFG